jgi:hypothetical protein
VGDRPPTRARARFLLDLTVTRGASLHWSTSITEGLSPLDASHRNESNVRHGFVTQFVSIDVGCDLPITKESCASLQGVFLLLVGNRVRELAQNRD